MHLMIWDTDYDGYRGITFFEPNIPKYNTLEDCTKRGTEIIGKTIFELNKNQIKTGEWQVDCIEVKKYDT